MSNVVLTFDGALRMNCLPKLEGAMKAGDQVKTSEGVGTLLSVNDRGWARVQIASDDAGFVRVFALRTLTLA